MEKPAIEFANETVEIGTVKAKAWRIISKLKDFDKNELVPPSAMIEIIVDVFDDERVTAERIEKEVNLEDIYPLFLKTYAYVIRLVTVGLKKVNEETKKKEADD